MKPRTRVFLLSGIVVIGGLTWLLWPLRPQGPNSAGRPQSDSSAVSLQTAPITAESPKSVTAPTEPIPASVQPIASTALSFPERVKSVRTLGSKLTTKEIEAFYGYLHTTATPSATTGPNEHWLRNEMLDKLVDQTPPPLGLADLLIGIYEDPAQDLVMRDYAVQHMMPAYARVSSEEQTKLQESLWQATQETDSSIAGTALLALRDLAQDHSEFEAAKLGATVLKLSADEHCGELSRITALQLCGRMGLTEAGPAILQLAQRAESIPLQIAAIAALGDLGNEEAHNYLRQLAADPNPRLGPALQSSLRKMSKRLGI